MAHAHAISIPTADELTLKSSSGFAKLPLIGLVLGVVGLVLNFVIGDSHAQNTAYLVSFLYFLSFGLGAIFFVITNFLVRSGWNVAIRRIAEAAMLTVPVMALLFIPIVLGMEDIFHWAHPGAADHDPILQWKQPYLNTGFFIARAVVYFVLWTLIAVYFHRKSVGQDSDGSESTTRRLQMLGAPAVAVMALSATFAAFDWSMSTDPHWFSTIFGVVFFAGSQVAIFAMLAVVIVALRAGGHDKGTMSVEHMHGVGKMLLGFTVFWTYVSFSQFFLIWYGAIPEETLWYANRFRGAWRPVSYLLLIGHFILPFFFFLTRWTKRWSKTLVFGAIWLLVMHFIDMYWQVKPNFDSDVNVTANDLFAFVGIGGIFLAVWGFAFRRHPIVPVRDPRLPESLSYENL